MAEIESVPTKYQPAKLYHSWNKVRVDYITVLNWAVLYAGRELTQLVMD